MAIGLTSEQLFSVFAASVCKRLQNFHVDMLTADAGVNPAVKTLLSEFKAKCPEIDPKMAAGVMAIVISFMDAIAANNEAVAKVIPHVEL